MTDKTTLPDNPPVTPVHTLIKLLIAGVLALNLVVAGMIWISLNQSRRNFTEQASVTTRTITQILEANINAVISKVDLALLAVSDEAERQLASGIISKSSLDSFIGREHSRLPELEAFRATNAAGEAIFGPSANPVRTISLAHRDYFIHLRDTPHSGLVVSKPLVGGISGKLMIVLARRINNPDGTFAGLVYAGVSLDWLSKSFSTLNIGPHGMISLIDSDFSLIARYPAISLNEATGGNRVMTPYFHELLRAGKTTGTYVAPSSIDSVERVYSFRTLTFSHPFYIFAGLATSDYLRNWHADVITMSFFMAAFLIVTALLTWLFQREWFRRRRAEQEGETRIRDVIQTAMDGYFVADREGRLIEVNKAYCLLSGYDEHELLALHISDLEEASADEVVGQMTKIITQGEDRFATRHRRKDGSSFDVEVSVTFNPDGNGQFVAFLHDISAFKRVENELKQHSEMIRGLVANVPAFIAFVNAETLRYEFVNNRFEMSFNIPKSTIIGSLVRDIIGESNFRFALPYIEKVRAGESTSYENTFELVSGRRWAQVNYAPVFDVSGRVASIVVLTYDITDLKMAEEEKLELQGQLLHAQKLESLGIMAEYRLYCECSYCS